MAVKELSAEAGILLHYLKSERERGTIGPHQPITGKKLAEKMDTTERDIQARIKELRNSGVLIAITKSGKGYFLGTNSAEMGPMLKGMKSRITELSTTVRAIEGTLRHGGQTTLNL